MSAEATVLGANCPECGSPAIEESRRFGDDLLAVKVCPTCHAMDWQLPSVLKDFNDDEGEITETKAFRDSEEWAWRQSRLILRERGLVKVVSAGSLSQGHPGALTHGSIRVQVSEQYVKAYGDPDQMTLDLVEKLAKDQGRRTAKLGQFRSGMRVDIA